MDIPVVTEENPEPPQIDEELKARQLKMYSDFAKEQKSVNE